MITVEHVLLLLLLSNRLRCTCFLEKRGREGKYFGVTKM